MAWPFVFGSMPAGNVPASDLDANFNAAVLGAASSTDGFLVQFDGTTGKAIKNGGLDPSTLSSQLASMVTGTVATGITTLPYDNTIPQNTEGTEFMTLAITPSNASSTLEISVVFNFAISSADDISAALFRDATANAVAAAAIFAPTPNQPGQIIFTTVLPAAATVSTTFALRAGPNSAGTLTFNGSTGAGIFGGVMASSITIREILP